MTFKNDCVELFDTDDLYKIMKLERSCNASHIKKAYYRQSIVWHPDRFASTQHDEAIIELAKRKFQVISRTYSVLADNEKRKIYDQTGLLDNEENDSAGFDDWVAVFRGMFKEVTLEEIEAHLAKYRGSSEEVVDVKAAYIKHKGNMDKIMESVPGVEVLRDEDRIREILRSSIDRGEVRAYTQFTDEPARARMKRVRNARAEAEEAAKILKEMNERKRKEEGTDGQSGSGDGDLRSMILSKQRKRAGQQEEFLAHLESKYGGSEEPKKRGRKGTK